jgi:hypothetical protein
MHPLETYLAHVRVIRSSGQAVDETSYYPALSNLLNAAGEPLKPRVHCIINLKNRGAGLPDGGLFTHEQIQSNPDIGFLDGTLPARGVIEAKSTSDDAWVIADSEQVSRYWGKYKQVLVTNYRDFVLVGRDALGAPVKLETYRLAPSEKAFWNAAAHPHKAAQTVGDGFLEFLKRALLQTAALDSPKDVAWFLASYAREANFRMQGAKTPNLSAIRAGLEEALGMRFEGERGDHFFRSTLVQTLFYGMFSAWVLWSKQHPPADRASRFDWRMAAYYLRLPILRKLFHEMAEPGQLDLLHLSEVLDWAAGALNRIDRASFFSAFQEAHAVQYFYEPFLEAFDPELRKDLGVWYTPDEIVSYMVARVDRVLRDQLDCPDGLADPNVYVLDPCCGTGTFLVGVLQRIAATLREKGGDALLAQDLKKAAMERVFGFEILPAPFVVAHLQLGLLLQNLGAPLSEKTNERARVFLTNALTGWEPPKEPKQMLMFSELQEERDAAEEVKRDKPILVILGNPPYNSFAGIAHIDEERGLSEAYRTTKRVAAPQGQGLNDLYIRFFRMAERRIVEKTGKGVVCYISNYSWLDGLSHTGMRERYLEAFDHIWIDNLNGDKYKTGKLTPEGAPDPSVFSTEFNKEGIQVGTAVSLLVRENSGGSESLCYRDLWGREKRAELADAAETAGIISYETITPETAIGLPFTPMHVQIDYLSWPLLPDLFPTSFPGVKTSRDDVVVQIDRDRLEARLRAYFDPNVSEDELASVCPQATESTAIFNARETRRKLQQAGQNSGQLVRYCYRPYDFRWLFWTDQTKLLDRPRTDYIPHISAKNSWIAACQHHRHNFDPPLVVTHLGSLHVIERGANLFPLFLKHPSPLHAGEIIPNLSDQAVTYLGGLTPESLFLHAVAVLHTPEYRTANAGALRQDWPRIPLPANRELLAHSSALGQTLADLLDPDSPVRGVTQSPLRPELQIIGAMAVASGTLDVDRGDLQITAGWGHPGKGGVTMPARGRAVERDYLPTELAALEKGAQALGLTLESALAILGERTFDVYLNGTAYWRNVPARVWEYTLGGYQVIKKWLSYREHKLLGRSLSVDEAHYVTDMARRIAAILLLGPELDRNYAAVRANVYVWPAKR